MNINVVFAWPVLTTVFTIFLYWSASWYYIGYTDFYKYTINVFDLPLALMLIEGLVVNSIHVLYLITALILISFISSVNKEQWKYFTLSIFAISLGILVFTGQLLKPLLNFIPNFGFKNWIRTITARPLRVIKVKLRKPVRFLILCGHLTFRFLRSKGLTEQDVRRNSFISTPPTYSFSFAIYLHYFGLLALSICLLLLFKSAQSLAATGEQKAKNDFNDPKKLPNVLVKDRTEENLRNTNICFKGLCLITDKDKNVRLYDMKEVTVLNKVTNDIKKAPSKLD